MARTLEVGYRSGETLSIEVVARGTNTITETITMAEKSTAKTRYTGTVATATEGLYELLFKVGSEYVGFAEVWINGTDGTTSRAVDGTDHANVLNPTATVNLSGTTVKDATDIQTTLTAMLVTIGVSLTSLVAAVWAYATRTLTQPASQVADLMSGSTVTLTRGNTITFDLLGLGDLTGRTKLWITGKQNVADPDSAANFQIEETAGLLRIGGAAPVALNGDAGAVTVTNQVAGNIRVTMSATAGAKLKMMTDGRYDVKHKIGTDVISTEPAELNVNGDVTRAVA